MIVVHATLPIDEERLDEAADLVRDLAQDSRAETGVVDYRVATDLEDRNVVRIFEQYEDEDALAAHGEAEHFQDFQGAIPDLLAGEPTVKRFAVDSVSEGL